MYKACKYSYQFVVCITCLAEHLSQPLILACPTFCFTCFLPFQIEMVAQGNDGVVLKVTCARPALTEPSKVYALKGLINYHNAKTMSRVSHLNNA